MMKWSQIMIIGVMLILMTNIFILVGVANNRSGEPESRLLLSERELEHVRGASERDNSGVTLYLRWRVLLKRASSNNQDEWMYAWSPIWLEKNKLIELGFDVERVIQRNRARQLIKDELEREVYLVLEQDGAAYQQSLKRVAERLEQAKELQKSNPGNVEFVHRAERAAEDFSREKLHDSRLFVVDAGLDREKLRNAYPDRNHNAIMRGTVRLDIRREQGTIQVGGQIHKVSVDQVNVPFEFRQAIEKNGSYEANVAFGKRLEPWVLEATAR